MKNIDINRFSALYTLRRLGAEDAGKVREIAKGNPAFEEYGIEEIIRDMSLLPPGKEMEEKYYLGYFEEDEMVGVLDFIDGYPEEDTAYIGLFMLSKYEQGKRIGTSLIEAMACYFRELGYRRMLLGYDKANPQAAGFWRYNRGGRAKPCPREQDRKLCPLSSRAVAPSPLHAAERRA